MWDDYGQEHENKNYIIRNKYTYARLRFYEFQSGIFAYIDPRCRSPPPSFQIRTKPKFEDGTTMKKINLKDYYSHITVDTYIDIPDEVFNIFEEYRKAEQATKAAYATIKPTTLLTVVTVLNILPCLFPSHPMRFTSVSSQPNSSMLPLPPCRISRQNVFMLTTF